MSEKVTRFVGLDYHQDAVQVCVMDGSGQVLSNRSCRNDCQQIAWLVGRDVSVRAAIESCCGAADLAEELVQQAGWSVDLAHAGYVSRIKQSPDKTDWSDAKLLADLERVGYLPRVWLPPEGVRELRRLVRFRQQLVNARRSVKLRIGGLLRDQRVDRPIGTRWSRRWMLWLGEQAALSRQGRWIVDRQLARLAWLGQEIATVEQRLEEATADDPLVLQLRSFQGIGLITACMLRAEIGRFDRFRTGKQLSRFCGLSPRNASSGSRQADAGLNHAANGQLRATLIEAAWRLMRFDPRWKQLGRQMRQRGKPGSVVAAAVANRWVRWLYHQVELPRAA